jgi:hypothetical protein
VRVQISDYSLKSHTHIIITKYHSLSFLDLDLVFSFSFFLLVLNYEIAYPHMPCGVPWSQKLAYKMQETFVAKPYGTNPLIKSNLVF